VAQKEKIETAVLFITMTDSSDSKGGSGSTNVKFAWNGNKKAYPDEIAKELGVAIAKDNEPGLIFGMNKPRPARVYINVKGGSTGKSKAGSKGSSHKSYLLFADPKKLGTLLIKNSLRGKKYRGGTITSVSLPKTSTNPNRSKKKGTTKTPTKKKTK
jgi:hypothetical protein